MNNIMSDMEYFLQQFYKALNIPANMLGNEPTVKKETIEDLTEDGLFLG